MRKIATVVTGIMLSLSIAAYAESEVPAMLRDLKIDVEEGVDATLVMSLDTRSSGIGSNAELWLRPVMASSGSAPADTCSFKTVIIAGRNRHMRYERGYEVVPEGAALYRTDSENGIQYICSVPYAEWMGDSEVSIIAEWKGCCGNPKSVVNVDVAEVKLVSPTFTAPAFKIKATADAGPKIQKLKGSAFVDFRVNRTEIDPAYRNNILELSKIINTVESVRENKDASIKEIRVKGFASPEGSYSNNERLARERTESLKRYVIAKSDLQESIFHSSYEPEDWEGLRRYVSDSLKVNREGILKIIDSDLKPDAKEAELKKRFPAQYEMFLKEVYPALRHTDYEVGYEIRKYRNIDDIRKAFAYRPSNLSENELMMLLADTDPESVEFKMILRKGREMFDKNPTLLYLDGIDEANSGHFDKAAVLLEAARKGGIDEASDALESIAAMSEVKTGVRYLLPRTAPTPR